MKENQRDSNVNQNRSTDEQKSNQNDNRKVESSLKNNEKDVEREGEGTKMPGRETKTPVADSNKNINRQ